MRIFDVTNAAAPTRWLVLALARLAHDFFQQLGLMPPTTIGIVPTHRFGIPLSFPPRSHDEIGISPSFFLSGLSSGNWGCDLSAGGGYVFTPGP
jgi:hypothetical protein